MNIDYEKVDGFRTLDAKEQKGALADYAMNVFAVKLNKQKSFDNMLADLVAALPDEEEKPELLIDSPEPEIVAYKGEVTMGEPVIEAPNIPDVVIDASADFMEYVKEVAPEVADQIQLVPDVVEAPVSASDESKGELVWLEGFSPTIFMMGRSASSNGYYTCPWWIYDWIKQTPDWYKDPDSCPHASAIDTIKSLAFYIVRDGEVRVRETRNSRFETFKF
ncbi:minor head protein inhibitor of protease [Cronobacter phage vB_CsaM_GAP161]|uniref:Minor capsid protein inhibitor of 21 protease n=1 Tax=Cronobacter phage vB_CsaM_GAP161 TaxID=1141138 RepID=K4F7S9_9CAUD|nr:minor head protein inhibitor of protease [Cronobacter phage vB_CsaM_GAP161]AFC22328.1 minor capsid protein inhibitor of 21 protease [Cronobacter phage vB_CsaM_GAP161]